MAAERVQPGTGCGGDATIADRPAASAGAAIDHWYGHSCCTGAGRGESLEIRFSVLVFNPSDQHYDPGTRCTAGRRAAFRAIAVQARDGLFAPPERA